ncbi:MAG: hypothetical protein LBS12_05925, partial [Prevotellaceae bacterium]|nr:hypothetical protein [Prevotellaceae bacterium]
MNSENTNFNVNTNKAHPFYTGHGRRAVLLLLCFLSLCYGGYAQSMAVNDDEVYIGPLETAKVNVLQNDVITCNNPVLRIVSYNTAKGTATLQGDFIRFQPAPAAHNETVVIVYGVSCNAIELTATLSVHISKYNRPGNVTAPNVECWNFFPANGAFNGRNKFNTNTASPTHAHRLLA